MTKEQAGKVLMEWRAVANKHNLDTKDVMNLTIKLAEACIVILATDREDAMRGAECFGRDLKAAVGLVMAGRQVGGDP